MHKHSQFTSPLITADWLHDNLGLKPLVILDVRTKNINESGTDNTYIPKARYANIKRIFCDPFAQFPNTMPSSAQFENDARELGINNDSNIVIYDSKGIYWSARLYWLFKTFGCESVAVLDGGLPEWKRLGYATVSSLEAPNWECGKFSAEYRCNNMTYFKDVTEMSLADQYVILDARSEERFQAQVPEPRAGLRSGTIPNSKNLPYTRLMNGNRLKSKAELQSIFDTFEIGERALVFSCGSGVTACILAIAAEICNYKYVSVYDGSWTEYGTLTT